MGQKIKTAVAVFTSNYNCIASPSVALFVVARLTLNKSLKHWVIVFVSLLLFYGTNPTILTLCTQTNK
jgi:hypothetical protein